MAVLSLIYRFVSQTLGKGGHGSFMRSGSVGAGCFVDPHGECPAVSLAPGYGGGGSAYVCIACTVYGRNAGFDRISLCESLSCG